ncbi:uncharacterized protein NP_1208A [Natronomonas pharaonis DSM 2160]|uniref:Uncharacterized protein n=1 Tax=Natronomonas pharaonis (strain ATCC 35678 / DSM 2160 / CIP 103997 / JCM 8858 / NBRC 14720 / NCIMB 2260 / Gabara) TaxID=348780 RepID=A0A1U7EUP7_NATPD|nr:circadian clock protein KaiC [Natronomonas pharaonis]CAI48695.1 uncharacterized protein NP_1208A [Natronomonas pharaonis DSM 2160]
MYPTGLPELDRHLGGGVPPGTLVALTAPPNTQSERLLERLAAANETRYVTTLRDAARVRDRLPEASVLSATPDDLLFDPETYLSIPSSGCLVVDSVTELERDTDTYREFLETAARETAESDGIVVLHAHEAEPNPPERWLTLARADMTVQLSLEVSSDAVTNRLAVTKHRGGAVPEKPMQVRLSEDT